MEQIFVGAFLSELWVIWYILNLTYVYLWLKDNLLDWRIKDNAKTFKALQQDKY